MKKFTLFFPACLFIFSVFAQTPVWVSYSDNTVDAIYPYAMATDNSGNVYAGGGIVWGGGYNYYLVKMDAAGAVLWSRTYNGGSCDIIYGLVVDHNDDVIVSGVAGGPNCGEGNIVTIKYDRNGNELWQNHYNYICTVGYTWFAAQTYKFITVDASNNIYVAGGSTENGTGYDYVTMKIDGSTGNTVWKSFYNGPGFFNGGFLNDDNAWAVALDGNGFVYVTGGSDGSSTTSKDFCTIKYDAATGLQQWAIRGTSVSYFANAIAIDRNGDVVVAGAGIIFGNFMWHVSKIKADGTVLLWSKSAGQIGVAVQGGVADVVMANDIAIDAAGDIYVTGNGFNGVSWDYFTYKFLSASGTPGWSSNYSNGTGGNCMSSPSSVGVSATRIFLDNSGGVFVSGYGLPLVKYNTTNGDTLWNCSAGMGLPGTFMAMAMNSTGCIYTGNLVSFGGNFRFQIAKFCPTATPVSLISFTAEPFGNEALLHWTVASASAMVEYLVQRSTDGKEFEEVTGVASSHGTGEEKDYSFSDTHPLYGTTYYRLKMMERGGNITYSNVTELRFSAPAGMWIENVYPGPVNDKITLTLYLETAGEISVGIIDMTGKNISNIAILLGSGSHTVNLNTTSLSRGAYLLRVSGESGTIMKKFVKL